MRTSTVLIPVAAAATLIMSQQAAADFSGPYAPANWLLTTNGGTGGATNDGTTLVLTGDNNAPGNNTDYTIAAAASGTMSFDWNYTSIDTGTYDSGGYLINGAYTALADNATPGGGSQSIPVNAGDIIGFRVFSADGLFGPGVLTITNFSGPVPAPGALALLGLAGLTARRRRRQV